MNGSPTAAQYAGHRRLGPCHEVVGVDDHRASSGVADCGVQLVQRLEPEPIDAHVGLSNVVMTRNDAAISSGRRMRNACRASARKRRSARTTSRT